MSILLSTSSRQKGNDLFRSACIPTLPKTIREMRFGKALKEYITAREQAVNSEQEVSASKNIGSTFWKLAQLAAPERDHPADRPRKQLSFMTRASDAEINLRHALSKAHEADKSDEWVEGVTDQLAEIVTVTKDTIVTGDSRLSIDEDEFDKFRSFMRTMSDCHTKALVYLLVGVSIFKRGMIAYSNCNDFVQCLLCMRDSQPLLHEARRLIAMQGCTEELQDVTLSYLDMVLVQLCVCESRQAVTGGDQILNTQLKDEEQPDMDMIWTTVDFYRQGVLQARGRCLESEALAHSRLGVLYHKVLKMRPVAKMCFTQALNLAASMHPKDVSGEEWHKEASLGKRTIIRLDAIQDDQVQAERAKLKEELKDQLNPIHEIVQGNDCGDTTKIRRLLKYIYNNHPPKRAGCAMGSLKPDHLKKTMLKAIQHYHADKQQCLRPKKQDGSDKNTKSGSKSAANIDWGIIGSFQKWEILCSEISCHLSNLYSLVYKGS